MLCHIGESEIRDEQENHRFNAGLRNFERNYRGNVNDWALYDNTGIKPVLMEWGENT
jgi:hypothetical protein